MTRAEHVYNQLIEDPTNLGITINPPADWIKIKELENLFQISLPSEVVAFYLLCNGFETEEDMFRVLSIEAIIEEERFDINKREIIFCEYMTYCDMWYFTINELDTNRYYIKYDENKVLTDSIFDFIGRFIEGDGVFGKGGLYDWNEEK